jgi:eukaryotic-like serine/threonine-protein kinase
MASDPAFIGKFRIEGLLGRGAMGVVYKAHDPDIDRTVAIKLVRSDLLESDDRAHYLDRFRNEAKAVGRFLHPNIVAIYDFAVHEGNPFLVLEYIDGQHIGRHLKARTTLDLGAVGRAILQVLDALGYAHGFSIVHRDIKPANLLQTSGGTIKVADFGISRLLESAATMSSVLVGTPCYMSPEQCLGQTIDGRSDLFSLGCVLYEIIAGRRAFDAANYVATTHKILHEAPVPLQELHPDLPDAIVRIVSTALAKSPADRFASAGEMAGALRDALRTMGVAAPAGGDADLATVITVRPSGHSDRGIAAELESLDQASLDTLERRLAPHLGPMARHQLQRTLRQAQSLEALCQALAEMVPPGEEREELLGGLLTIVSSDHGSQTCGSRSRSSALSQSASGIPIATVDAYAKALAHVVGPIAPFLLRRALTKARTPEELEDACIALIDQPQQAQQFRHVLRHASG